MEFWALIHTKGYVLHDVLNNCVGVFVLVDKDLSLFFHFCQDIKKDFPHLKIVAVLSGHVCGKPAYGGDFDRTYIKQIMEETNFISPGSQSRTSFEWSGGTEWAQTYVDFADEMGFQWCPAIVPRTILTDIRRSNVMLPILRQNCPYIFPLSLYVVWGYFHDSAMPEMDATSLKDKDLQKKYNLSPENLTEWITEVGNVISGAGGQDGLNLGTPAYAKQYNCKGLVCGLPFKVPEKYLELFERH